MDVPQPTTLDTALKLVQMAFYAIGGTVAVLTFRAAKRGLLNTVNTEYHKRVIDRLHRLSEDLYAEYDPSSEHYWPKHDVIGDAVRDIDEAFKAQNQQMYEWGEYLDGIPVHKQETRLKVILEALLSDPFVPPRIRLAAVDLLEKRLYVGGSVMLSELEEYGHRLARREIEPGDRDVAGGLHNHMMDLLRAKGCGITDMQNAVHGLREMIQEHFEGFNPHRSRLPRWRPDEGTAGALLKRRREALDKAMLELSNHDGEIVEIKS